MEDIRFPEWHASEDNAVSYNIMDAADHSVIISYRFYHYAMRDDSVEHKMDIAKHLVSIIAAEERYQYISELYPNLENLVNINRWNIRLAMFDRVFMAGQQKKYIQELNE